MTVELRHAVAIGLLFAAPIALLENSTSATRTPERQPETVAIGNKRVPISSQEIDKYCAQVVAPFDIDVNAMALAKLTAESLPGTLGGLFKPGAPAGADVGQAKHTIALSVREKAARMNWLPMSAEKKYGQYIHQQFVDGGKLLDRESRAGRKSYPTADALLARVLQGVDKSSPYTFELYVRASDDKNAIALPGGIVYIDAGFLKDKGDLPTAYFALAHEISHVLQRHETRIVQARLIDAVSLTGATKDMIDTLRNPDEAIQRLAGVATSGGKLFERHYGAQEMQADSCAVRVLDTSFKNDKELEMSIAGFIESLPPPADEVKEPSAESARSSVDAVANLVEMVSKPIDRHPTTQERFINLKAMMLTIRQQRQSSTQPQRH